MHATLRAESPPPLSVHRSALVVDLDGTLIAGDMLIEQIIWLVGRRPFSLLKVLLQWLRRPVPLHLKQLLAKAAHDVPVDRLSYRESVLDRIRQARADQRRVILATASITSVAERVAAHIGLFDEVIGSGEQNLRGPQKLVEVHARLGEAPFEYIGDHAHDRVMWAAAREVTIVASSRRARRLVPEQARHAGQPVHVIEPPGASIATWLQALRVHQWSKNLLVLLPVIAGQRLGDASLVQQAVLAAIAACCVASAVYLANDLLDVHADRAGTSSRVRPIADGTVPYAHAVGATFVLTAGGLFVASRLEASTVWPVVGLLIAYLVTNAAYSLRLKRVMMLDIVLLSTMYLWRILLGSAATGIVLSDWLLAFSVFFFLGLACAKRCIELATTPSGTSDEGVARSGRGYHANDLPVVREIGIGSALVSILVLALYLKDAQTAALYTQPQWLWAVVLLTLYWVTRLWLLVARGAVSSDPVEFATRDRTTYAVGAMAVLALFLAR